MTDSSISQELYDKAKSPDKTIKLYDDMWHALLAEPEGGAEKVLGDIVAWINSRV